MKILWLEPEPPIPPLTGGRERARRLLTYVAQRHDVYLVTGATPVEKPELMKLYDRLAGITAVPYHDHPRKPFAFMHRAVKESIHDFKPDIIHVHGLDLWPYAPDGTCRILDLHNAPHLLQSRLQAIQPTSSLFSKWQRRYQRMRSQRREISALRAAAAIIVVSDADKQALSLSEAQLTAPLITIPNGVNLAAWPPATMPADSATIFFPGALNWLPNIDAARILVEQLLPRIHVHLPEARLVIAGRLPTATVVKLAADHPHVTLIPNPPHIHPLFTRATLVAVPLRAGAGSRLKILQALAVGRPVISTPLGAEGLGLENGRHLITAPLTTPFANAMIELLTTPHRCQQLSEAGRADVVKFEWKHFLPGLDEIYG